MKSILRLRLFVVLFVAGVQSSFGASVMLDSFSEGSFLLQGDGTRTNETSIVSPFVTTRTTDAWGNCTWSVTLPPDSGVLTYVVAEILAGQGGTRFAMGIEYINTSGGWSFLGYDALVFDFTSVTGEGLLEIFVSDQDFGAMVRRSVAAPGLLVYPLEDLAASDLGALSRMSVRVIPQSETFSFSLNEITVVPEPSILMMLLSVAFVFCGRRVRRSET